MFVIREEQLECFTEPARCIFEDEALNHLTDWYRDSDRLPPSPPEILELIRRGIDKALTYRISNTRDIICLLEWMVEIDPDFDELAHMGWAKALLNDEDLSGKAKIDLIATNLR